MISVVIAAHNARDSIRECLTALLAQAEPDVEIVVVDNSTDRTGDIVRAEFSSVAVISASPGALVPHLWAAGIRHSAGEIVALTIAHCVPRGDWISRIRAAHQAAVPAVGGAIENDEAAGPVDWAIYFCRYSRFMLPFADGYSSEIPGDNASYKRAAIDRHARVWQDGFWEPAVHAALLHEGHRLLLSSSMVVYHRKSYGFWGFLRQRFQHGMQFARWHASGLTPGRRVLQVVRAPAVAPVLLARIGKQVWRKRRHQGKFLLALPLLIAFLLAWALGEVVGYLQGPTP